MKRIWVLLIVVLVLLISAIPAAAITNGEMDNEHPNVGLMVADIDGEPRWRCSGTLIAPRVFLTAGHCVGDGATAARVWFGQDLNDLEDYPAGGGVAIEGIPIPHPDYAWVFPDPHDVGVVILDEAVEGLPFATLPAENLLSELHKDGLLEGKRRESVYFTSVGYGLQLSWPPHLFAYDLFRMTSQSEYVAMNEVYLRLTQKMVFDEEGSCSGDSGGPVFWMDPEGNEILVAVTSAGDGACMATGFDYRLDIPEIRAWILEQVALAEEN